MMYRILFLTVLLSMVLGAVGCNKNQDAANASDAASDGMPTPVRVEVATGDMKDILLALTRIHFAFDSSELVEEARRALDEAADKLRVNTDVKLYVDGHSDSRGTTEYNLSLGERRARKVVDYLGNSGVDAGRLQVISFGEEKPLEGGAGSEAHARNRRVDFRLMRGNVQFVLADGAPVSDAGDSLTENQ